MESDEDFMPNVFRNTGDNKLYASTTAAAQFGPLNTAPYFYGNAPLGGITPAALAAFSERMMRQDAVANEVFKKILGREVKRQMGVPFMDSIVKTLKNYQEDRLDLDELVELYFLARGLGDTYTALSIEQPTWFKESLEALKGVIVSRRKDSLRKALAEVKAKGEALKTAEEKRVANKAEQDRLEKLLAE